MIKNMSPFVEWADSAIGDIYIRYISMCFLSKIVLKISEKIL